MRPVPCICRSIPVIYRWRTAALVGVAQVRCDNCKRRGPECKGRTRFADAKVAWNRAVLAEREKLRNSE